MSVGKGCFSIKNNALADVVLANLASAHVELPSLALANPALAK